MPTSGECGEGTDQEPLDVEMSGDRGKPEGVAELLRATARHAENLPEDMRLDVKIEIQEVA